MDWTSTNDDATAIVPLEAGWVAMLTFAPIAPDRPMLSGDIDLDERRAGVGVFDIALVDLQIGYAGEIVGDWNALRDWADARKEAAQPRGVPPVSGITTRLVRGVSWGDLQRQARRELQSLVLAPSWARRTRLRPRGKHEKQVQVTLSALASLAAEYLEAIPGGRPIATLAARRDGDRKRISNLIERARAEDLLTRPAQGRAGGALTDKAKEILDALD